MPSVFKDPKRREKLFRSLDQVGAHFLASASSRSSEDEDKEEERASLSESEETGVPRDSKLTSSSTITADEDLVESGEVSNIMSMRYSRVASDDRASPITEAERSKRRRTQLAEKISNKLHALLWAVVGITVAVQTDFVRVLLKDERVNRVWFNVGLVCFGINVVILAYLTVWLPHVRGIKVSWNVYSPRAIPTATVFGLICALTLNMALWNVWGFLTPLILFAVFIGCLFSLHFVPWPC